MINTNISPNNAGYGTRILCVLMNRNPSEFGSATSRRNENTKFGSAKFRHGEKKKIGSAKSYLGENKQFESVKYSCSENKEFGSANNCFRRNQIERPTGAQKGRQKTNEPNHIGKT